MTERPALLEFAVAAAREAGAFAMRLFRSDALQVKEKQDRSPVTQADRGAEQLLRERIHAAYPGDGILGEEYGEEPSRTGRIWILDPIDGTRAYLRGIPFFSVLVGVEEEGESVAGVAHFPALGETMAAARGQGAVWMPGEGGGARPARVSAVSALADSFLCLTSARGFLKTGRAHALERLNTATALQRGYGDAYGHMLVATGRAELMLDPIMAVWDCAALAPIVEEAGGRFTDFTGARTIRGGNALSTNGRIHDAVLALL
ncbi:MAG: inositol monophosphatase family protein [Planctomycetaceae bacterium]